MLRRGQPWLSWGCREQGPRGAHEWRLFLQRNSATVSGWHDIAPIPHAEKQEPYAIRMLNEIPKGTRAKIELDTKARFNPMRQDVYKKTGELRSFRYGDIPFNYGMLPRTWENPDVTDPHTGNVGDGDPLDVVLIGDAPLATGDVVDCRVVGVLGLIDEGETDWKIIAIPACGERVALPMQHAIDTIRHWFRYYKTADGKPENTFAFDGEVKDADFAMAVIRDCMLQYDDLLADTKSRTYWTGERSD